MNRFLMISFIINNNKPYFEMSGLQVVLNALYRCVDINTYHYIYPTS